MTTIYLIRHAESKPSNNTPEPEWPLSKVGEIQAENLAKQIGHLKIDHIFSSPYPRAVDTVYPLACERNIKIQLYKNLRERKLTSSMIDNWLEELENTWKDFDYKLPAGESNNECQRRVYKTIDNIVKEHLGQNLVFSSHGNAIALFLNKVNSEFGFINWKAMKNPDIFKLTYTDGVFTMAGEGSL